MTTLPLLNKKASDGYSYSPLSIVQDRAFDIREVLSVIPDTGPILLGPLLCLLGRSADLDGIKGLRDFLYEVPDLVQVVPSFDSLPEYSVSLTAEGKSRCNLLKEDLKQISNIQGDNSVPTPDNRLKWVDARIKGEFTSRAHDLGRGYSWLLEGGADQPSNKQCGWVRNVHDCEDHKGHNTRVNHYWCHDSGCPVCYHEDIQSAAKDIVDRFVGGYVAAMRLGFDLGPIKIGMISPPQDWASDLISDPGGYKFLRERMYEMQRKLGAVVAVDIFHPFRVNKRVKYSLHEPAVKNGYGHKLWRYVRDHHLYGPQDKVYDYNGNAEPSVHLGPHWHFLTCGFFKDQGGEDQPTNSPYGKWVYKIFTKPVQDQNGDPVLGPDKPKREVRKWYPQLDGTCPGVEELYAHVTYLLSHSAILLDNKVPYLQKKESRAVERVTWFGAFSQKYLSTQKDKLPAEEIFCPVCGRDHEKPAVPCVRYEDFDILWDSAKGFYEPGMDKAFPTGERLSITAIVKSYSYRDAFEAFRRFVKDIDGEVPDPLIGFRSFMRCLDRADSRTINRSLNAVRGFKYLVRLMDVGGPPG